MNMNYTKQKILHQELFNILIDSLPLPKSGKHDALHLIICQYIGKDYANIKKISHPLEYALLTYIIANITGLVAKELIVFMADAHIYTNHVDALQTQILRRAYVWSKLVLSCTFKDIDDVDESDISLVEYEHHPYIHMKMAI